MGKLKEEIRRRVEEGKNGKRIIRFSPQIEKVVREVEDLLENHYPISKRGLAMLLLLKDPCQLKWSRGEKLR